MTKVIVVGNQKGGSGKTTVSIHLSSGLARFNKKTLLIDADSQKTSYRWALSKAFQFDTITLEQQNLKIPELINKHYNYYDFIVVDCPPAADSETTHSALLMADLVLVPIVCSPPDLWASLAIRSAIDRAKAYNNTLKPFIVINRYQPRLSMTKKILKKVEEFKITILKTSIGNRIAFSESAAQGTTVFSLKDKTAIEQVEELSKEILNILE
jgi:chromosome partitioning protein